VESEFSMAARAEIARSYAQKYAKAPKALKSLILDEVCGLTGWSKDNARRRLTARAKDPPGQAGPQAGSAARLAPLLV
jgi:hypothetical protein